jgi:hypothetical protein
VKRTERVASSSVPVDDRVELVRVTGKDVTGFRRRP